MSGFLLAIRVQADFVKNAHFLLAKSLFLEMKSDVLKATIWDS
jgi:hypothetical protein